MSWNYRVIYHEEGGEGWYNIHSVHYEDDKPELWSVEPMYVQGETPHEIGCDLQAYMRAMYMPVLEVKNEKLVEKCPALWPAYEACV